MYNWSAIKTALKNQIASKIPPYGRRPKIEYRSPNGYLPHSYMYCLEELCFFNHSINEIWRTYTYRCLGMKDLGINPYYVAPELLDALLNTDLPDLTAPIRGSAPFLKLFLPSGALLDDNGDSIVVIVLEDFHLWHEFVLNSRTIWAFGGKEVPNVVLKMMESIDDLSLLPRFTIHAFTEHGSLLVTAIENNDVALEPAEGIFIINNGEVTNVLDTLKRISVNLLYLLESHPEYISTPKLIPGTSSRGQGFGSISKRSSPRPPRCIGLDFNLRVDSGVVGTITTNTTNLGKITHLRRGHWRRQRIGSGLKSHKYTWIKPMLINAA